MALTRAEWEVVISFEELGEKAEVYTSPLSTYGNLKNWLRNIPTRTSF